MMNDFEPVATGFDYNSIAAAEVRDELKRLAERARTLYRRTAVELGTILIAAKKLVPYGTFETWAGMELSIEERSAQRYMRVAAFCYGKPVTLSLLPLSVLYRLTAPSAPPAVVEIAQAVVRAAEAGTPLADAEIKDRLAEATPAPPPTRRPRSRLKLVKTSPLAERVMPAVPREGESETVEPATPPPAAPADAEACTDAAPTTAGAMAASYTQHGQPESEPDDPTAYIEEDARFVFAPVPNHRIDRLLMTVETFNDGQKFLRAAADVLRERKANREPQESVSRELEAS